VPTHTTIHYLTLHFAPPANPQQVADELKLSTEQLTSKIKQESIALQEQKGLSKYLFALLKNTNTLQSYFTTDTDLQLSTQVSERALTKTSILAMNQHPRKWYETNLNPLNYFDSLNSFCSCFFKNAPRTFFARRSTWQTF